MKDIEFAMQPELAKAIKPHLRLAIYGYPVTTSIDTLKFVPTKYVAFNISTGEIYAEVKEDDLTISN